MSTLDVKELRIGNAIWDDRRQCFKWVNHRVINDLASHNNPMPYSPISITAEILEKFGFKLYGKDEFVSEEDLYWIRNDFPFSIANLSWRVQTIGIKIKSLHQLQNLFYAFTEKEL